MQTELQQAIARCHRTPMAARVLLVTDNSHTGNINGTGNGSFSTMLPGAPSVPQAGDVLLVVCAMDDINGAAAGPSGAVVQLGHSTLHWGTDGQAADIFTYVLTAADVTAGTVAGWSTTVAAGHNWNAMWVLLRGVDGAILDGAVNWAVQSTNSASGAISAVTLNAALTPSIDMDYEVVIGLVDEASTSSLGPTFIALGSSFVVLSAFEVPKVPVTIFGRSVSPVAPLDPVTVSYRDYVSSAYAVAGVRLLFKAYTPTPHINVVVNLPTAYVGHAYSGSVTGTNANGATGTITYSVDSLPAGLTLNTATGAVTGTPTATSTITSNFTATNGTQSAPAAHAWSVITPSLTLTGTLPATATAGVSYSGTLTLGGNYAGPVTISAASGTIPAWMTVTVSGTTVTFAGTPASGDVGTDSFTPQATDSLSPPQVASGSAQSVVVGAASAGAKVVQQAASQWASGVPSVTLAAAPTVGNMLVALIISGNYGAQTPAAGWTLVASGGGGSANGYWCGLLTRTVASGDGTTVTPTTTAYNSGLAVWEVSGASAVQLGNSGKLTSGTNTLTALGASAPSAASIPLSLVYWNSGSPNSTLTWSAGWTGVGPPTITGYPYYGSGAGYAAATSAAVVGPTVTWTGTRGNAQPCLNAQAYVR